MAQRYEAYDSQVLTVQVGNKDMDALRKAIGAAKACTDEPMLIRINTIIGYGSPNQADSHDTHGAPFGTNGAAATSNQLGGTHGKFPLSLCDVFRGTLLRGRRIRRP